MGTVNLEALRAKRDSLTKGESNYGFDKLEQGKNVRRVLFPKGSSDSFYSEGYVHFGLGAEGKKSVTCPKTFGENKRCPICEYVESLKKSKDPEDAKLADRLRKTKRIYINVINRDSDDETIKVLPIGRTIFKALIDVMCDPDYDDITKFDVGRDVTITRTGQGLKTEYSVLPKPKQSMTSETKTRDELDEEMPDLESLFKEKTYDELKAILNGEEENESYTDEDELEEPKATKSEVDLNNLPFDKGQDYEDMSLDQLEALCKERGIKLPAKVTVAKLAMLLTMDDEDKEDAESNTSQSSPKDETDDVQQAILNALNERNSK